VTEAALADKEYQRALAEPGKHVTNEDGTLYYKNRLWIPENLELKKMIISSEHNIRVAGHMGMDKTTELIRRYMWWKDLEKDVASFVRSCHECQQIKHRCHAPFGLLQPLDLPFSPWKAISMDFITELPTSNGCTQIWVIVDTFTKQAHFIPLRDDA
jgi:hypothetical protein